MTINHNPFPIYKSRDDAPCCGTQSLEAAGEDERAGYEISPFVTDFVDTEIGKVPRVGTSLGWRDRVGAARARGGLLRDGYRIAPGLYCTGKPGAHSPVLVTANYKLTFDALRRELDSVDAWILVLDTRGVNVWCAASHKTFGTDELVRKIKRNNLERVVSHRQIIVPQLGATGVDARKVRQASGFEVIWGPVRSADIPAFLANSCRAAPGMRKLTFTIGERLVLSPVELTMAVKPLVIILTVMLLLGGIVPWSFSFDVAWSRWAAVVPAFLAGILSGAVLVPALLPWLPFRAFFIKGFVGGLPAAGVMTALAGEGNYFGLAIRVMICLLISSSAAMNFTGATPFASPSGVEKEMRLAIPIQIVMASMILLGWLFQPFL